MTPLVDAHEIAELLDVPLQRVWAMTRAGKIPVVRLGFRTCRYGVEAVMAALEGGGENTWMTRNRQEKTQTR